ncbi:RBBP9/YdeN family alpha/beta hydrolase [Stappia sp. ICDLI1TA098]
MVATIVVPGIGGSGEAHWQTVWERRDRDFSRFAPSDWDRPELGDWIDALERAVEEARARSGAPPLLLAHSLACLLVPHWVAARARSDERPAPIAGAVLVAVPDPAGPVFPAEAASFAGAPDDPLPFPSLVVASESDPYGDLDYCRARADCWGASFFVAGPLGHINGASGLGDWPQGFALFEAFRAMLAYRRSAASSLRT